jgi:putative transport protein
VRKSNVLSATGLIFLLALPVLAADDASQPHGLLGSIFQLLVREQFVALFLALGFGHLLARVKLGSFALNTTAATLLVALVLSGLAYVTTGLTFSIPDLVQTTSLTLFLYAVGLRVGPQFLAGLKQEGFHLIALTLITATLNFALAFGGSKLFGLAPGFTPGMISGGYNVTAVMGVATQAVQNGTYQPPAGTSADQVIANIAAGYSLTYIFSLLAIVLLMTHLPQMFGIDPVKAAKESEKKYVGSGKPLPGTDAAFKLGHTATVRVFKLENEEFIGQPAHFVFEQLDTPVLRITRNGSFVPLKDNPALQAGDLLTIGGERGRLIGEIKSIGPEVADERARDLDIDQAEIVLTKPEFFAKTLEEFHASLPAYGIRVRAIFRLGNELPLLPGTKLQKHDVIRVVGPAESVRRAINALGQGVRPTDATQLVTLSLGAAVGYLVGLIAVPVAGIPIGLGTPAAVIIAGVTVATLRALNPRFGGPVPEATRSFLENIGLDSFVCGLGLNVAPALLGALSNGRAVALVVAVGMVAAMVPPVVSWIVGLYVFKMDPILLAGAVAGSRSSTTAMKALQDETKSAVPAFGYPVPYALSAIVVLIYGYLSMVLS